MGGRWHTLGGLFSVLSLCSFSVWVCLSMVTLGKGMTTNYWVRVVDDTIFFYGLKVPDSIPGQVNYDGEGFTIEKVLPLIST